MEADRIKELCDFIKEETFNDGPVSLDTQLESLVADSLEFVSLMVAIRDKFGTFPTDVMDSLTTVANVVEALEKHASVC